VLPSARTQPYAPGSEEWLKHKKLYYQELQRIQEHNAAFAAGKVSARAPTSSYGTRP
jgi:hypothetical protein